MADITVHQFPPDEGAASGSPFCVEATASEPTVSFE